MSSSHYVIISEEPVAWTSCLCLADRIHKKGEEVWEVSSKSSSATNVVGTEYLQGYRAGVLRERQRQIDSSVRYADIERMSRLAGVVQSNG